MAERRVANPRIGAYHARPIVTHAPPDPRFADLIRRIQEDARPRFQSAPCSPESRAAIDDEIALDRELNDRIRDLTVPGAGPPYIDHEGSAPASCGQPERRPSLTGACSRDAEAHGSLGRPCYQDVHARASGGR